MESVFAVSSGDYSDYRIVGVFSTEELAQKYVTLGFADAVEEWVIDDPDAVANANKSVSLWHVRAMKVPIWDYTQKGRQAVDTGKKEWHFSASANPYGYVGEKAITDEKEYAMSNFVYYGVVWAKSREHAEKIIQDEVHRLEAEKAGIA